MKNYIKTKLKVEEIIVKLQLWEKIIFWVNKDHFRQLQIYEGQYFMKNNWKIWILQGLREKIKIIPWIKYIRIYLNKNEKKNFKKNFKKN